MEIINDEDGTEGNLLVRLNGFGLGPYPEAQEKKCAGKAMTIVSVGN